MGLPVPQVFMYVNDEDQLEIIDGQQRILSIKYFLEGFFGEEDNRGRRQVFSLRGLSERSEYNGKSFDQLSTRDQRRFRNSTLRSVNIKQISPTGGAESVFHIFQRLNTGGTRLRPQEIRNAVYRGEIVSALQHLSTNDKWHLILGLRGPDRSQKDVELVLRLFSLFEMWHEYEKPMLQYLNMTMDANRSFASDRAERFKRHFPIAVDIVADNLQKPFRPKRVINAAVLEAVFISILENIDIDKKSLQGNYNKLMNDAQFQLNITGATTDTRVLKERIRIAKEYIY
jgi:hypothetical protein